MRPVRLAIIGYGRMGQAIARLAASDARYAIAGVVVKSAGHAHSATASVSITNQLPDEFDVAIDFSSVEGALYWTPQVAERGAAIVNGVTGLDETARDCLRAAAHHVPTLWAPNMSVGVNLLINLVEQAAAALPGWDIELIETHHRRKVDAPSGTAIALLDAVRAARPAATRHGRGPGDPARDTGEIGVHAVRLGGVVGEHELRFASEHEVITLSHAALTRDVFAGGALRAAEWIATRSPGFYTMRDVLAESAGPTDA